MKRWMLLFGIVLCFGIESAHGAEAPRLSQTFAPWIDSLKVSGDLRLRHESFLKNPDPDRHR